MSKLRIHIAKGLSKTMRCFCDLDNWEPEHATGHSWVCQIHDETNKVANAMTREEVHEFYYKLIVKPLCEAAAAEDGEGE